MKELAYYEEHIGLFSDDMPVIFNHNVLEKKTKGLLHWHEGIELLYCIKGEGYVLRDGERILIKDGGVVLINPGQLHNLVFKGVDMEYEYLILENQFMKQAGTFAPVWFEKQESSGDCTLGQMIMEAAKERDWETGAYSWLKLKGQLYCILAHLIQEYGGRKDEIHSEFDKKDGKQHMQAALTYMKEHFREELTSEQVSRMAGYSTSYFSHKFKEIAEMSMFEYINMLRCENARRLILGGGHTITQAAEESGFRNRANFYKMYKRFMGCLPSEERRLQK